MDIIFFLFNHSNVNISLCGDNVNKNSFPQEGLVILTTHKNLRDPFFKFGVSIGTRGRGAGDVISYRSLKYGEKNI